MSSYDAITMATTAMHKGEVPEYRVLSTVHYLSTPKCSKIVKLYPSYRAMLYITRTMLSKDVCLSVRPSVSQSVCQSVTRRYCVKTARQFLKHFYHRLATPF